MERWTGKVAVVTGASAGIGAAIAAELVRRGLRVAGLARRVDKIQELAQSLTDAPGTLHAIKCDLSKEEDILSAFSQIEELGGVDILINNAGVLFESLLSQGSTVEWRSMWDVNVLGLSICTREAFRSMRERQQDHGHMIHINSIAGHYDVGKEGMHMYSATKHAVTALTEGLRRELVALHSNIRVTSISPGLVETEMFLVGMESIDAEELYSKWPSLKPQDIADAVVYVLGTPPHVQIHELTIKPVGEINL
ncbi:dehydrogenase/reductase SDR family member 11-like [Periplaneta americana]|uniref:dehydrogenase/reductase SDR family member 11-like n=1 Tax=Periplaneta americana TaxID=6978 RepID=UPI0037E8E749